MNDRDRNADLPVPEKEGGESSAFLPESGGQYEKSRGQYGKSRSAERLDLARFILPFFTSCLILILSFFHSVTAMQYGEKLFVSPAKLLYNSFIAARSYIPAEHTGAKDVFYLWLTVGGVVTVLLLAAGLALNGYVLFLQCRKRFSKDEKLREEADFRYRLLFPGGVSRFLSLLLTPIPTLYTKFFSFSTARSLSLTAETLYITADPPFFIALGLTVLTLGMDLYLIYISHKKEDMKNG